MFSEQAPSPAWVNPAAGFTQIPALIVSPTKPAQPIHVPFGARTRVGSNNHVLHGPRGSPQGKGQFVGVASAGPL